jgi:hypothetical protein
MKSNFDNPLVLKDARTIVAAGPLEWDPGDADHCRITVQLTQGALSASGDTGNYNKGDATWKCNVQLPSGQQWNAGQTVHCVGTINPSGPPPPQPWPPQDVSLQPQQAAAPA